MKEVEIKLVECAAYGDVETISQLLNQGVDVNAFSCSSFPLFEAVSTGNVELIKFLLANQSIDLNRYEKSTGYTALHVAIFYSQFHHEDMILKLILNDSRLDIYAPCKAPLTLGYTPLHLASFIGNLDAIDELLRIGASVNAVTEDGLSVFDVAGQSASCKISPERVIELIKSFEPERIEA
jgi:ankyrin repeat protein